MRNPRTGGQWQRVLGLALVVILTLMTPVVALADAGPSTPGTTRPSGTRVVARDLELRTTPSLSSDVLTMIPDGSTVTLTGDRDGQFAKITFGDASGWVEAEFLLEGVTGATTPTPATTGFRSVTEDVNLRTDPNTGSDVITVLKAGTNVRVTGATSDTFTEVTAAGETGWVASRYLQETGTATATATVTSTSTSTPAGTETPAATESPTSTATGTETPVPSETAAATETAVATETPATTATATEVPAETVTPSPTESIRPTETLVTNPTVTPTSTVAPTAVATTTIPPSGNSLVIWPVKGGTWEVSQGYNGSSHQDNNDLWQYLYSFDLIPVNGAAAGQPVYSPVNGTIKWFDPSTGGIAIDMGDGLAFAMFHMEIDGNLKEGQQITQGQHLGIIAYPGSVNGGFPHLHITAWSTSDGGNWDRHAIPFTGSVAISGTEFPANGGSQQYTGYTFTP